jgi:hypothetical protein
MGQLYFGPRPKVRLIQGQPKLPPIPLALPAPPLLLTDQRP